MAAVEGEGDLQVEVEPLETPEKHGDDAEEEEEEDAPLTPPDEPRFIDVQPLLPAP